MEPQQRDPAKDAYIRRTAEKHNRREVINRSFVVAGAFLIIAFTAVSLKQSDDSYQASILQSASERDAEEFDEAIRSVRDSVGWYDTDDWNAIRSPIGLGVIVVMSDDFLWYVEEDGTIYVVNGLAKTITPEFEYAKDITADDIFTLIKRE